MVECTVTIEAQDFIGTMMYADESGKIELIPEISDFTSSGKGTLCEYTSSKEGVYVGASEVSNSGGTLEWS